MPSAALSGFVLAGGRSSRMGQDKALVELDGKPLIEYAVSTLQALCVEVAILSGNPALARYAPLVPDLHPGCGPIGGLEAALAYAKHAWSLILPVDVPFLPQSFLAAWIAATLEAEGLRLLLFCVDGVPQPTILLIHRDLAPSIARAVREGKYKLFPVLQAAAEELAHGVCRIVTVDEEQSHYFANLNTPEELAAAQHSTSVFTHQIR